MSHPHHPPLIELRDVSFVDNGRCDGPRCANTITRPTSAKIPNTSSRILIQLFGYRPAMAPVYPLTTTWYTAP